MNLKLKTLKATGTVDYVDAGETTTDSSPEGLFFSSVSLSAFLFSSSTTLFLSSL